MHAVVNRIRLKEQMRANVVPHAAAPPDRLPGEIIVSYEHG